MKPTPSYLAAAALAAALGATAAMADDRPPADGMNEQAISQIVTYAGYDVVDIDLDGGVYRVEAYAPAGERVELRLQAEDGAMLPLPETDRRARHGAARD
ncbi:MAG: hypothetical protein BroJett029_38060 [Alphaproteobacteria bacterium]|nr:MAG: hypothetical protein BroJett029_38060 [Alphaproteobacteria bacterium]